jgi:peptidoglycan/LPS O-acetylase OafA/YrhL
LSQNLNYRPEIDGLRAIAVLSVIFYHADIIVADWQIAPGGFIGVDVFFVISGYLISRIIFSEINETDKFDFLNFFERRVRRLLPALMLVIVVTLPYAWTRLLPFGQIEYAQSVLATLLFLSNFFFYEVTTSYAAQNSLLKPLLHTWSLGVEEQFYIFFSLTVILLSKLKRPNFLIILALFTFCSFFFAQLLNGNDPSFGFFSPFSRFWELFLGAIIGFSEVKWGRVETSISPLFSSLGILLIVFSLLSFSNETPHPSYWTLIPVIGTSLVITFASKNDLVCKFLSLKPLVIIGLISYSTYLWHYPIMAFSRLGNLYPDTNDKLRWLFLSLFLGFMTYIFVERTFRDRRKVNTHILKKLMLSSSLMVVLLSVSFLTYAPNTRLSAFFGSPQKPWETFKDDDGLCHNRTSRFCYFSVSRERQNLIVLGDSLIGALSTEIYNAYRNEYSIYFSTYDGCVYGEGIYRLSNGKPHPQCTTQFQQRRSNLISGTRGGFVIYGGWITHMIGKNNNQSEILKSDDVSLDVLKQIEKSIIKLSQTHSVILIDPFIDFKNEIFLSVKNALSKEIDDNQKLAVLYKEYLNENMELLDLYGSLAIRKNVHRIKVSDIFCKSDGFCYPNAGADAYVFDNIHPTSLGAKKIVSALHVILDKRTLE